MKVSVIIPSLGRPEQIKRCVERLAETVQGYVVETVVVFEGDDPATAEAARSVPGVIVVENTTGLGAAAGWNEGSKHASGDALVMLGDDAWFHDGWLEAALQALEKIGGSGMVGFNDGHTSGETHSAHHLLTRDYIIEYQGGCFIIPDYYSQYFDLEAVARAQRADKYIWASDSLVEHKHWVFGTAVKDATYRIGSDHMNSDRDIFQRRRAAGFPDDFEPILMR